MALNFEKLLRKIEDGETVDPSQPVNPAPEREADSTLDLGVVDRYGKCPCCEATWDGGDILDRLTSLSVFDEKSREDLVNIASNGYGYNVAEPRKLSNLVIIAVVSDKESEFSMEDFPTPPNFFSCRTCGNTWDFNSGKHLGTLRQARKTLQNDTNNNQLS